MFAELHEIFFSEFMIILIEWLERLLENTRRYRTTTLRNWTHDLVRQLNSVRNKTSRVVDFWLNNILWGYIMEFAIDFRYSYSVVEREFFKGPCGRLLKALGT